MSDTYYKPLKIAENIYHIYEPGNVYTTLIIGEEKALLIDTGYGFGDLAAFVRIADRQTSGSGADTWNIQIIAAAIMNFRRFM